MKKYNNIIANMIVLFFGYIGLRLLQFFDKTFNVLSFTPKVYIGVLFIFVGVIIRILATLEFTRNKVEILKVNTPSILVTSGIYKYSRNPLYLGIIFVTLGFVLISGSVAGLLFVILFFVFWNLLIKYKEEPELKNKFGNKFENYKLKVSRWI